MNDDTNPLPMRRSHPAMPLTILCSLLTLFVAASGMRLHSAAVPARNELQTGLDPNHAAWHEWCVLPGIGPSRAKAIVDYRESQHESANAEGDSIVFHSPRDLMRVRGLGAKTVSSLQPWLNFRSAAVESARLQSEHEPDDAIPSNPDAPLEDGAATSDRPEPEE